MTSLEDIILNNMKFTRVPPSEYERPLFTTKDLSKVADELQFDDLTGWIADVMKLNPAIYKEVINKLRVEKIKTILED